MKKIFVTRRINSKFMVLLALQVAQRYMQDWKGKEAVETVENLMSVQGKIMDVKEIPFEEFTEAQLNLFEERRAI